MAEAEGARAEGWGQGGEGQTRRSKKEAGSG